MLRENRNGQVKTETSETLGFSQKLQVLTDENLYLERRLKALVLNNRALQSIRSRSAHFKL